MLKIIPVPNYWLGVVYVLPLLIYAALIAYKLPRLPKEKRSNQLAMLGIVFSLAGILTSLMKFPGE